MLLAMAAATLTGCAPPPSPTTYDQCARKVAFDECLAHIPPGPTVVNYNDWAEVVDQCGDEAAYLSIRRREVVPIACRSE